MVNLHDCYYGWRILMHGTPSRHVYGDDSVSRRDRAEQNRLTFSDKHNKILKIRLHCFFGSRRVLRVRTIAAGDMSGHPSPETSSILRNR